MVEINMINDDDQAASGNFDVPLLGSALFPDADSDDAAKTTSFRNMPNHMKLITVLNHKDKFPDRQRDFIDGLVDTFLDDLGDDIHDMMTDQVALIYGGLDASKHTEEEVETAALFFSDTLTRRKPQVWNDELEVWENTSVGAYPINCLPRLINIMTGDYHSNLKAAPFVHVLARVAIHLRLFDTEQRGGLVAGNVSGDEKWENTLQCLLTSYDDGPYCITTITASITANNDDDDDDDDGILQGDEEQGQELRGGGTRQQHVNIDENEIAKEEEEEDDVDSVFLTELIELRRMGLLKKEDIHRYRFMMDLCMDYKFSKKRFEFVAQWDPTSLLQAHGADDVDKYSTLLHYAANDNSIVPFRTVLDYCIRYYPFRKGITMLFQKDVATADDDGTDDNNDDDSDDSSVVNSSNDVVVGGAAAFDYKKNKYYYPSLGDDKDDGKNKDEESKNDDDDSDTPFQIACDVLQRENVMDVVNDVLATYSNQGTPLNTIEAIVLASSDKTVHLDCTFFLLRREPHVLKGLGFVSSSSRDDNTP